MTDTTGTFPPPRPDVYAYRARLVRWLDGDTLVANIDQGFHDWKHDQHIRLLGVEAPKGRTVAGRNALAFVHGIMPPGAEITIRTHRLRDAEVTSFERWVAAVWTPLGDYLPDLLIAAGHAVPWDGRGASPLTGQPASGPFGPFV